MEYIISKYLLLALEEMATNLKRSVEDNIEATVSTNRRFFMSSGII